MKMLLTVGPDNDTGFRKHLEELSYLMKSSQFIKVKEKGAKQTIHKIQKLKPNLTIIGGRNWIIRNNNILDKIPGKVGVLYCSPLGQAEISNGELKNLSIYLEWLDKKKIDYLFVGSEALANSLKRKDIVYLPALSFSDLKVRPRAKIPHKNIVAILNDKAIHKNILNTLAGVSLSRNIEGFWINGAREEYFDLMKRFRIKNLKSRGYIPRKDFYNELKKVKLLLQLSFSEGFSYSTFEAMNVGVPVLTSRTIPWNTIPLLKVNNCEDHEEIAKKIDKILSLNQKEYAHLSRNCIKVAKKAIEKNNSVCQKNLKKLFQL